MMELRSQNDGQRYLLPLCENVLMCDGERGGGAAGADDLCSVDLGLSIIGFEAGV